MGVKKIFFVIALILLLSIPASADDDEVIHGKFAGAFTVTGTNPIALFAGVLKLDDERLRFDGETYVGVFPDGTPCDSPIGVCSAWITEEGIIYNQTDTFISPGDGTFTQTISFIGGTDEFEGASGMASVKGTQVGPDFRGKIRGVIFDDDDDDEDDDYDDD